MIKTVDDATLYCFLPTKASWGFPFLMNTDMIPKGDRNDIETEVKLIDEDETNFNEELASIAGSKLYLWIKRSPYFQTISFGICILIDTGLQEVQERAQGLYYIH